MGFKNLTSSLMPSLEPCKVALGKEENIIVTFRRTLSDCSKQTTQGPVLESIWITEIIDKGVLIYTSRNFGANHNH